jgi:hypothetical protein
VKSLPNKRRILKKERGSKDWKEKEVNPHMKKLHVSNKKKRGWNYKLLGEILSKERKKERRSHFPIVQNPMCGLIYTHTSFAFALPSIP